MNRVGLLSTSQVEQFKRDGYLLLPGVLDAGLCRRARDEMWEAIAAGLPRMKRDDSSTWGPITEEENARLAADKPESGGEPYLGGKGHRFYIRNGFTQKRASPAAASPQLSVAGLQCVWK